MRITLIAKKMGMSSLFRGPLGLMTPVTLLHVDKCRIIGVKSRDLHGYDAIVVGSGVSTGKNLSKPVRISYEKLGVNFPLKVREFRVSPSNMCQIGDECIVDDSLLNKLVDISGVSIGKGFAGVMKRHNFRGLEASHGVSVSHRSHGSTGQCQDPGKVFKGKKMAGHLGCDGVTVKNLRIVDVDSENGIIAVKGAVPGFKKGYVIIRDALKYSMAF